MNSSEPRVRWACRRTPCCAVFVMGFASACGTAPPAPSAEVITARFACDHGKTIDAVFVNSPGSGSVRVTLSDGRVLSLPQTRSGSGARYATADDSVVFWNKGETAFVEEGGRATYTNCVARR